MTERRSILIHGLGLTLRRLPAFLWTAILIALPLKNISWFPERLKTGEKPI